MRARIWLALATFVFCAGCGTLRDTAQSVHLGEYNLSLSDEEIRFAQALAHYGQGLICQDSFTVDAPESTVNLAASVTNLAAAIELDPETARLYPALAVSLLALKENDKAIEVLRKAVARNPEKTQPLVDLAVACEKTGHFDEAVTCFRQALRMAPQIEGIYRELALIFFQQKKHAEALNLLKDAVTYVSNRDAIVTFCYNLGKLYESTGMDEHAVSFYELAGTSKVKWPDPVVRIASIYMKNDMPKAVKAIDRALESMPDEPKLLFLLGLMYSADKQFEKAITAFQRTERTVDNSGGEPEKNRLNPVFYINYGSAFERSGQHKKAEEVFRKCLGMYPDSHEILNYLAYMLAERGENLEEGLKYINKALELNPDNGAYMDTLGWIYYKQKKYDLALEQIRKANTAEGNDPTIIEHLGDIYFALNDKGKAIALWKQSFMIDQNSKTVISKLEQNGLSPQQVRKEIEDRLKGGKPDPAGDAPKKKK
jgi:tetratricopeptide (TPR) repeat protein